jgi:carbonic anhydrase/acetyltransferase-like protein (isoleucine patch superfamily)
MTPIFERELDKLRTRIIKMGSLVDEQVEYAFRALNEWNVELAKLVMERDAKVDKLDFKIEKQCQRIFALQQPVARDLRLIMAAMKINSDLERMGDLAFNVARSVEHLAPFRVQISQLELTQMTDTQITDRIEGFVDEASDIAGAVIIEKGAEIVSSRIRGPAIIGAGARIVDSYIGPYSAIGPDSLLERCEVEYSILMDRVSVRDIDIRIEGSILGNGVEICRGSGKPRVQRFVLGGESRVELV